MQHIDRVGEAHGIHDTECIALVVSDDFNDPSAAKPPQRFGVGMFAALLRDIKSLAHSILDGLWKRAEIDPAGSHPDQRFEGRRFGHPKTAYSDITIIVSRCRVRR